MVGNPAVATRKVLVAEAHKWGHTSRNKLVEALNTTFWWKGLIIMVKEVVENCLPCKQARLEKIQTKQELAPTPIPTGPGKILYIDLITFVCSTEGNRYVIVTQDWFFFEMARGPGSS